MKAFIKVTNFTHTELSDFLSTALYCSIWASASYDESDKEDVEIQSEFDKPCHTDIFASLLLAGKTITINDNEEEKEYKITLENLIKGFNKVGRDKDYRHHVWNIINEDYVYYDADIILQFAIFGEETYA